MLRLPKRFWRLIFVLISTVGAGVIGRRVVSSRAGKWLQESGRAVRGVFQLAEVRLKKRYFSPKISLVQQHSVAVILMCAAFVAGSYFTISEVLLPRIRALSETSLNMPTDVAFNRDEDGDLAAWDNGDGSTFALAEEVRIATSEAWWNPEFLYKKSLSLNNISEVDLASGSATTAQITINTKALYDEGKLQDTCNDLRVVRVATDSAQRVELPRSIQTAAGAENCGDSTGTVVSFPMERFVASGSADANYEVYYGGAEMPSAIEADENDPIWETSNNSFSIGTDLSKKATLVCPFNGTTTCADGETPSTKTGAIRFSGGRSALEFDGVDDYLLSGVRTEGGDPFTIEMWIKPSAYQPANWVHITPLGVGNLQYVVNSKRYELADINPSSGCSGYVVFGSATANQWDHLVVTYDGETVTGFVNGIKGNSKNCSNLRIDAFKLADGGNARAFKGVLDEVRVSSIARYNEDFEVSSAPLESDEFTLAHFKFDENGSDPRFPGKAIDASGNGNHGTIHGAKYVSGLVGVDSSPDDTGAAPTGSFASHQGVFIEEGTTNLITNPSFEHSATYSKNWDTNYFNLATQSATFTPRMSKRNSAGPFAAGVMVQSNADDLIGDAVTVGIGSDIFQDFHSLGDGHQGSVVFWITPEWNGDDGKLHHILGCLNIRTNFCLNKGTNNYLKLEHIGSYNLVDVSDWKAGNTYSVILGWDTKNPIDGTNYTSITVNGETTFIPTKLTPLRMQYITRWIGPSNSIIEGLTNYRRVLYDGTHGTDVGNGDEIAQIYNNGEGKDPTLITGSWDVVFALPTNAQTGELTSGTGEAWSHPHRSSLLYTNTTNTGGFMMNGTYTSDGWNTIGEAGVAALENSLKIFAGGYAATAAQWDGMYFDKPVAPGDDWVIRGLVHSDGTCQPQLILYDQTNGAEIGSLYGTTTSTRSNPDMLLFTGEAPAGTDTLRVKLVNAAESSGTCYWHQVELYENSTETPSMEKGTGEPWMPTGWDSNGYDGPTDVLQSTSVVHSGSSSMELPATSQISTGTIFENTQRAIGDFYSAGGFTYNHTSAGLIVGSYSNSSYVAEYQDGQGNTSYQTSHETGWEHFSKVFRITNDGGRRLHTIRADNGASESRYVDDFYTVKLNPVFLTVTPASLEKSTETTGIRVDGADTLTHPITNLSPDRGVIKFKFTPRHDFVDNVKFGNTNPTVFFTNVIDNNFLRLHAASSTQLTLIMRMAGNGSQTYYARWHNPTTFDAGTTYEIEISYLRNDKLILKIDHTEVASAHIGDNYFSSVPTSAFFGSNSSVTQQYDAVFDAFESLTPEENSTSPYYKFGSKSVKLTAYGSPDQYTIPATVSAQAAHALSAYVYNHAAGDEGGVVDATVAQLASGSAALNTEYEDMGGGWWRLTHTSDAALPVGTYDFGVQVESGRSVFVDGVQLEKRAVVSTYTDGSLGTGYTWSGAEDDSISQRAAGRIVYDFDTNLTSTEGSLSFWMKDDQDLEHNVRDSKFISLSGSSGDLGLIIRPNGNMNLGIVGTSMSINFLQHRNPGWLKDNWNQVIINFKVGEPPKLYVNGSEVACVNSCTQIVEGAEFKRLTIVGNGRQVSPDEPGKTISDVRVMSSKLSESEITHLYHAGLLTHTTGSEAEDRYQESGTYTSPTIDLGANGQWGSTPLTMSQTLNGGSISYFTRTSLDNTNWSEWEAVTGGSVESGTTELSIASSPRRYLQLKAAMSANQERNDSPVITGMTTTYVEDTTPPINPSSVALGYSHSATQSANLTSGNWYNHPQPKFTWESGEDEAGIGQSSSGVEGYHVLLTTNQDAVPIENTGADCYLWTPEGNRELVVGESPANCKLSDGTYYLKLQAKDYSGNVADPVQVFTYKYDGTIPLAPSSISTTEVGYQAENTFTFFWPAASDQGPSGVAGYEFKTGATEGPFSEWQFTTATSVEGVEAYQEGQNFFYVRTKDEAGNYSGETSNNVAAGSFYFNSSAPTAPRNVVISPNTTEAAPSDSNVFSVTWDKPASYSGEIAKYFYCVNCTPSANTMTETTAAETVERELTNLALATQQGKNTIYLVAEDNNVNTQLGHGNRNFEAYVSADFYASTTAPGAPQNLTISDASNREKETWRLTLAWEEPISGGTPDHYTVYRSTDGGKSYTEIGETTSTAYTDANLRHDTEYHYKVLAVDNAGSNSIFSNVVSESPVGKFLTPPSAGGIPSVTVGSTTATVSWTTARDAFGSVEYGKDASYGSSAGGTTASSTHSVKLTGLAPGTTYHFRTQSLDDSSLVGYNRDEARSSDYTFTTLKAAEIAGVTINETSLESAVISWQSSSLASATIEYGLTQDYGSEIAVSASEAESTHTARLSGLDHSSSYHFRIKGVDIDGTDIVSDDYTFSTITFPEVTAVIFNTDQSGQGTSATIAWSTNVPTTGTVEYQPANIDLRAVNNPELVVNTADGPQINLDVLSNLSQQELSALPVTPDGEAQAIFSGELERRRVQRVTGLDDGKLYIFTLRGRDEHGNEAVSEPIRYVTGSDTKPPAIENLVIETPIVGVGADSSAQIVISFETDEPAYTQVHWGRGTGSEYPQSTERSNEPTTQHVVVIRDLEPTSSYHMMIEASDVSGNVAQSEDTVVVTPTAQEAAFDIILRNLEAVFGFL